MMIFIFYDANVLTEIKQEMQTIKVKLQHWTLRQEHVFICVCMLGIQVCRLKIIICIVVMRMHFILFMLWLHT